MTNVSLSKEQAEEAENILAKIASDRRISKKLSLVGLLGKWRDLGSAIERGYEWTIDDYTNDLTTRNFIDAVIERASIPLKSDVEQMLKPLDDDFISNTLPVVGTLPGVGVDKKWWHRIPKKLVGDLKEDVEGLGLVG